MLKSIIIIFIFITAIALLQLLPNSEAIELGQYYKLVHDKELGYFILNEKNGKKEHSVFDGNVIQIGCKDMYYYILVKMHASCDKSGWYRVGVNDKSVVFLEGELSLNSIQDKYSFQALTPNEFFEKKRDKK
jgi:hypothetical protein